jgi:hypothetical protein
VRFETLIGLWQDGLQRLSQADLQDRVALERVIDEIALELRRRLGGPFSVQELAALYLEQGVDWCLEIATQVAPTSPAAWDLNIVAGAAFARYAREAGDYAVGRTSASDQ